MASSNPIVYVEDDQDDVLIFEQALIDLGIANPLLPFTTASAALKYLSTTSDLVFLIVCDINLPGQNGLDFKMTIDNTPKLRSKSIPFVFFSTTATDDDVDLAFGKLTVQGFFQKPANFAKMTATVKVIFDYWHQCRHPNIT